MTHVYNSQLDAFDLYHQVQEVHQANNGFGTPALPALGHATAGSVGAAISNVVTYPLALIVTRLQIQRSLRKEASESSDQGYGTLGDAAQKIYEHEGGLSAFYAGIGPDTAKTIADSFLFFLAYNFLRQTRLRTRGGSTKYLPVADELSVGFLAGAFSKFLTTPIANIVTRQQAASMLSRTRHRAGQNSSIHATASQIRSERGLQGFWSGYTASLVLTLNPSLTFFLFETLKRVLLPRGKRADPPTQATFLIAAVSKAIASTITYPFSLAKSRAQASSSSVSRSETKGKEAAEKTHQETALRGEKTKAEASRNVFSMLLHISRTEGLGALYEGLGGEVLKGFFSHGLTMIVKQMVHGFIIRLYYAILRFLRRMPNPDAALGEAKEKTKHAFTAVQQDIQPLASSASEKLQNASSAWVDSSKNILDATSREAGLASSAAKQAAEIIVDNTSDYIKSTQERLKNIKRDGGGQ
ncbi:MAG: hypothetical protein Q9182_003659 [Xanthomendoza sp. 2 TL-2023]